MMTHAELNMAMNSLGHFSSQVFSPALRLLKNNAASAQSLASAAYRRWRSNWCKVSMNFHIW